MTTVKFFGENTGSLLFEMKFENGYSQKKYKAILNQINNNRDEMRTIFKEPVSHILVEKDRPHHRAEKGTLYGAEINIYGTGYNHINANLVTLSQATTSLPHKINNAV